MDGTWLNDQKTYDEELFLREFKIMTEKISSLWLQVAINLKTCIYVFLT